MKERILFVLAFFFLFVSGYSFVESYTLEDSPFEEANQFEPYFLKKNFLSISGLYHWGDVLNGKLRLGFREFFGELGYTQLFSIPIYTYSGDIEDFASSGVYSLGLGLVWNSEWYSLGGRLKLSYSYLLEVSSLRLSIDFFGKLNFDNFSYGFSLKNILSLGSSLIWTSRDTYLSIIPVVFDNSFVYSFNKNLRFLGGIKFVLYQEFDFGFLKVPITTLSMGNPHCVIFVEDLGKIEISEIGPKIEHHSLFSNRVNVEFVKIVNSSEISMRVWERGSGETMACGTGACASAVATMLTKLPNTNKLTVHLLGGDLIVEWNKENNHVYMTGGANLVFYGTMELKI